MQGWPSIDCFALTFLPVKIILLCWHHVCTTPISFAHVKYKVYVAMSSWKWIASSNPSTRARKTRRQITVITFNKWKTQYERDHQMLSWLRCDVDRQDKTLVDVLSCEVCTKHKGIITGMKNFWKLGSLAPATRRPATLLTMLPVDNTAQLWPENVLMPPELQTCQSQVTCVLLAAF